MASRSPRVVAVGDGIVDLVTPPMEDFAAGDVQAEVPRFDPLPGGNATNFALQMSSLGASTTFIGAVGSDSNAKLLRDRYREYGVRARLFVDPSRPTGSTMRSEEHTSELQSQSNLVCRLLLEKKKKDHTPRSTRTSTT